MKGGDGTELKNKTTYGRSNVTGLVEEQYHVKFGQNPPSPAGAFDISVVESLKKFGTAFKLSTPLPEDLQYIVSRRSRKEKNDVAVQDSPVVNNSIPQDHACYSDLRPNVGVNEAAVDYCAPATGCNDESQTNH
jgi:hypothetical protein